MVVRYTGGSRRWGDSRKGQSRRGRIHFCLCCLLCCLLAVLLAAGVIFYFLEQFTSWFHSLLTPSLGERPIEMVVSTDDPVVEICVRDFGCEDGDRVKLILNSEIIFQGELFEEARCFDNLPVHEGENRVDLTALNGTGGKGGCPNDINTGEITIIGEDRETHAWSQLAGEVASATVDVRRKD